MLNFLQKNKFIISAIATAAIVICVIIAFHSMDNAENEKFVRYIESFGWEIEQSPIEISHLTVPRTFDIIFENYNHHQKEAGFDLTFFKGARGTRYSYRVLNHRYSESNTVRANVIVINGEIVAADINSNAPDGFMHAITNIQFLVEAAELVE